MTTSQGEELDKATVDMLVEHLIWTCDVRTRRSIELSEHQTPRLMAAARHLERLGAMVEHSMRRDPSGHRHTTFRLLEGRW